MNYGVCNSCKFIHECRMVQEEEYRVGDKVTVVGVVFCDHKEDEK